MWRCIEGLDDAIAPGLSVAEGLLLDELGQPDADFLLNRKSLLHRAEAIAAGLGLDLPLQYPVERLGRADCANCWCWPVRSRCNPGC